MGKKLVVTVGSTHFDALIKIIDSKEFLEAANKKGFTEIVAQIGKYEERIENLTNYSQYMKPDEMKKAFAEADLVIGHGGAGTIMEVLQLGKPLIVVVNDMLMENHQTELARKLSELGILTTSKVSDVIKTFNECNLESHKLTMNCGQFSDIINEHFNFHS